MKNILMFLLILTIFSLFLAGCIFTSEKPFVHISDRTNAELIHYLESFGYGKIQVSEYSFELIVDELTNRGPSASEAAPILARVISYNGSYSVTASHPLIVMGPAAKSAIPYLLQNLSSKREDVRSYSIFVLGIIGEASRCAVPQMAPLLWDPDPVVRSTVAGALTEITHIILVEDEIYKLDPTMPGSVFVDGPDANISKIAREWWLNTGQNMEWPEENCDLPE